MCILPQLARPCLRDLADQPEGHLGDHFRFRGIALLLRPSIAFRAPLPLWEGACLFFVLAAPASVLSAAAALYRYAWGLSCLLARPAWAQDALFLLIGRWCDRWATRASGDFGEWLAAQNHIRDMTAGIPTLTYLSCGRLPCSLPLQRIHSSSRWSQHDLARGRRLRPINLQYRRGPATRMGVAEIIPSSPKTTTPCRTSVCTCTSSGTGTDRHRLS